MSLLSDRYRTGARMRRTDERKTVLSALTFNIRHGLGTDDCLDLDRVGRVIAQQQADVVALQEVDRHFGARSADVDQPASLGARLGMTPLFGANVCLAAPEPGAPMQEYGCALLTTRPVTGWEFTPLPSAADEEGRGLLQADLDVDGRTVRVCCVHMAAETAESRIVQAKAITDLVDLTSSTLLMGDLNAVPDSREVRHLNDYAVDVWEHCGSGPGHTFCSQQPWQRIDYLFASPDITVIDSSVVPVERASDHLAVRATICVGGSGTKG